MQLTAKGVVTGFTQYQGDIDGQKIDANTIFMNVSIGQMGKGVRTAARKCQDADVIKRISHLAFPFEAEIVMEETATRNRESMIVVDIKPIKKQNTNPQPAGA